VKDFCAEDDESHLQVGSVGTQLIPMSTENSLTWSCMNVDIRRRCTYLSRTTRDNGGVVRGTVSDKVAEHM
jgi:hypothetical protein